MVHSVKSDFKDVVRSSSSSSNESDLGGAITLLLQDHNVMSYNHMDRTVAHGRRCLTYVELRTLVRVEDFLLLPPQS